MNVVIVSHVGATIFTTETSLKYILREKIESMNLYLEKASVKFSLVSLLAR